MVYMIDTTNYQLVGSNGAVIIVMAPKQRMTKQEALVHAAWIVALADDKPDDEGSQFTEALRAVLLC